MSVIAVLHAAPQDDRSDLVLRILERQKIPYKLYSYLIFQSLGDKLHTAKQACEELIAYSHILFLDAYDVVVLAGVDEIMERFLAFQHPWVCNAEPFLWPPSSFQPEEYPPCKSKWKYLNSGAYLAEREYLHECLTRWKIPAKTEDQSWLAGHYLEEPESIKLDTNCDLFQCMIGGWWAFESSPGHLHNTATGTDPLILHHNGGARLDEDRMKIFYEHLL